jgi:hypothetical protein
MSKERPAEVFAIIGAPNRGKTTFLIDKLTYLMDNCNDRVLLIVPELNEKAWFPFFKDNPLLEFGCNLEEKFNPTWKGVQIMEYEEDVTFPFLWEKLRSCQEFKNFNLVLDDPIYMEERPEKKIPYVIKRKRQNEFDVWTTAHSFDDLPRKLLSLITVYIVGHTLDEITLRKTQLGHFTPIKNRINQETNVPFGNKAYHIFKAFHRDGKPY